MLINLIKNATESGGAQNAVELEIRATPTTFNIDVRDRGSGMSEAVLANAFLPFYSTKRTGQDSVWRLHAKSWMPMGANSPLAIAPAADLP